MLTFTPNGQQTVVTNEGEPCAGFEAFDARRDELVASSRAEALCENEFPDRENLIEHSELGRLTVSTIAGYDPVRNCFAELHAFGARSFSVITTRGELISSASNASAASPPTTSPTHPARSSPTT